MSSHEQQTEQGLELLERSQALLRVILLGIAMQYRSLDLQKQELLQGEPLCGPSSMQVQSAAALIVLCALFGFQKQAEELAADAEREGLPPDLVNVRLGAAAILVALIRLARLHLQDEAPGAKPFGENETAAFENAEDLDDLPL